jgi:hypothetical protein
MLNPPQAAEVKRSAKARNLLACKTGDGYCDSSLVSSSDEKAVANAKRERNKIACETGFGLCDPSLENTTQAKQDDNAPPRL